MADHGGVGRKYSCNTATETLEWMNAIIDFLKPYRFFFEAHVVNFFTDRLWEAVDKEWMQCLRKEPVEKLVLIPSGVVQDHWPESLKEFVLTSRSLSLARDQADLPEAFQGLKVASLNNVIAQGMNQKKKHEIEALAAVIGSVAKKVGAQTVVDVGSGQGYLAQVLSFEYELSVIAIDASSHHGSITEARAKRIEKYYAAKTREARSDNRCFSKPKTVTCQVLSSAMLKDVSSSMCLQADQSVKQTLSRDTVARDLLERKSGRSSLVLAGLHACGDLSVTMLRTFAECDEVKALVSIGCCYNLLSEEGPHRPDSECGFPVSSGAKSARFLLGKSARDLACQSADRWRATEKAASLHNFELHTLRAAFQMVLHQYYPEILSGSPAIGRQGKALRRQENRRVRESNPEVAESLSKKNYNPIGSCIGNAAEYKESPTCAAGQINKTSEPQIANEKSDSVDKYHMFVDFCKSGLARLGLHDSEDLEFSEMWKEAEKYSELVGPYWTLRATLGPILETILLLDRLLFLQEQKNMLGAVICPLFDPILSPRNVALIAEKF